MSDDLGAAEKRTWATDRERMLMAQAWDEGWHNGHLDAFREGQVQNPYRVLTHWAPALLRKPSRARAAATHEEHCCLSGHPNSPKHRLVEPCTTRCTCHSAGER